MRDRLIFVIFTSILLVSWEIIPRALEIPGYIFPALTVVIQEGIEIRVLLFNNTAVTALEALLGCILGGAIGICLGASIALSRTARSALLPYIVGSNAIPIVAVAPLVTMWFGHGLFSKAIVAAFLSFFPLAINTYRGLFSVEPVHRELFRVLGASRSEFFLKYQLPHALPYMITGLKLSVTFAVIGAVVAEFIGSDRGLGFGMLQASYNLNTPRLFAYLVVACILGVALYGSVALAERKWIRSPINV